LKKILSKELRWALSFLRPYTWGLFGIFILTFGQNYAFALLPRVSTNFLFELISPERIHLIYRYLGMAVGIVVLKALLEFVNNFSKEIIINSTIKKIRDKYFTHLIALDIDFFTQNQTGNLIAIGINDVEEVKIWFYQQLIVFISGVMMLIIILVKLFIINWQLTLISLGVMPLLYWIIRIIGGKIRYVGRKLRKNLAGLSVNLHETLTGIEVVKASAAEEYENDKFQENTERYKKSHIKLSKLQNLLGPLDEMIIYLFAMGLLGIGSYFIIGGTWDIKGLTEYLMLLGIMSAPLIRIPNFIVKFKLVTASVERINYVLSTKPGIKEVENPLSRKVEGTIEFYKVWFSYNSSDDVLQDISLRVEKGEIIALVGPSGAGKTTIANLIPRFYDSSRGTILIDDINIREYNLKSLRSQIGIVSQSVILFNTTILENIKYAKREATEEEVIWAAKKAYAYDFIMELPNQFETNIGEKGVKLSGGQKQRIAIARTILMNPQILILDEATSALDSESERYIQLAINNLMEGRTSITIAHRLSTISHATKIFVIDKGRIIEVGTHEELLETCDLYKKIYNLQYFR